MAKNYHLLYFQHMSIKIFVFASLSEQLGVSQINIEPNIALTARNAWQQITDLALNDTIRVAINQKYAQWDDAIKDGDELAFLPPVTGG